MAKTSNRESSIDAGEAAHFGGLAADWWDPRGSSAMLHRLNPVRMRYLRAQLDRQWGLETTGFTPLTGKTALDVGCGAGLACEPLARLGAAVTGVDAAPENIAAARDHAAGSGLAIEYLAGDLDSIGDRRFDLVTAFEVIEHVTDPAAFVGGLAGALAETGLLVLSTPNRTALSRAAMITLGEGTRLIPRGTHDWNKFLKPEELTALVEAAGLAVIDMSGIAFSPRNGLAISSDLSLNYLVTAARS